MTCEEAEELIGAYAIDALPAPEAAAVRAHLATCAEHAAKAAELRGAASSLAALADPVPPPPALRSRVLAAVAADRDTEHPRPIATAPRVQPRQRIQWSPQSRVSIPIYALGAIAAALVLLFGGLVAWNIALQQDDDSSAQRFAQGATRVIPLDAAGAGHGSFVYFADERKAVFIAEDVPALDESQTYQMWAIVDGTPSSIGTMRGDAAGHALAVIDFDASHADTFAVTVEPAGGSDAPTSEPVFVAEL